MIVVKVELHSAITGQITLLGSAIISNVGTTLDGKYGDYDVVVSRKSDAEDLQKVFTKPLRRGHIKHHPRLAQNVWRLVLKSIASAFSEEKVVLPDDEALETDHDYASRS